MAATDEIYENEVHFGGTRGTMFKPIPMGVGTTISATAQRWVNGIILNQELHGISGDRPQKSLTLHEDEYISYMRVAWWGGVFDYVIEIKIETSGSRQQEWSYGGTERPSVKTDPNAHPKDPGFGIDTTYYGYVGLSRNPDKGQDNATKARVLSIGGHSGGDFLGSLNIKYMQPYDVIEPTSDEPELPSVLGILDIYGPGTKLTKLTREHTRQLKAISIVNQFTVSAETQIVASYGVVEASSKFGFGYLNRQELNNELEKEFTKEHTIEISVGPDQIGLSFCRLGIRQSSKTKKYFLFPVSLEDTMIISKEKINDMTFFDISMKATYVIEGDIQLTTDPVSNIGFYHSGK